MTDITFVRPEYKEAVKTWAMVRDVCRGSLAVKSKKDYLPELDSTSNNEESERRNKAYRERAVFYAMTGHTKNGLLGMAFRRDPSISVLESLDYLKNNADGAGSSAYQQSQFVLESVLEVGRHGLYVDYSDTKKESIILSYSAENIINWRTQRANGRDELILVVLREYVEEPDGYGFNVKAQYRELFMEGGRFTCRVWREEEVRGAKKLIVDAEYSPTIFGKGYWNEIPFTFVGSQNNDSTIDESPLLALAEINLGHYRNSADYEDSVFFCGQVQPWISGLNDEWRDYLEKQGVVFGSRSPLLLPANGSSGFIQAQPNMLVKEALDTKLEYMIALGARFVEQNGAAKTATQSQGDQAAATSVLAICCSNVSKAYTQALKWCHVYLGKPDKGVRYQISQEFVSCTIDSALITSLISARDSGLLRDTDIVRLLQKMDIADPSLSTDEIIDQLNNGSPKFITGGLNANSKREVM